jgi:two-component system sensor histidine kinase MtrB
LTNQVVRPIRSAAESAQRLKAGRLTERIAIKGQDDLAVLASSFNSMAAGMQEQIRRLESLSRVQQRFVSDVSHELRTPLTTIRMASELLYATKTDFDPASERAVELLQQQSERFEILLNDLLEISRIDAGSAKIEAADLYFESILNKVIEDLSPVLRDNQLEVRVHQVGLKEKVITADFRRVERIVRNLVSNAIEHAEGKPIDLVAFHDENVLVFCARDYGVGLEPGQAALVFNRFWRADPSRQRTLGGTGLGLSISMEDARLHGGWLEADGALGQGANFRFVLPLSIGNNIGAVAVPLVIDQFDEWLESNS